MNTDTKKILHTFVMSDEEATERLDQALAKLLPAYSRTQIQEWIENASVLVNNRPAKAKNKVKSGDIVTIAAVPKAQPVWQAEDIHLPIVYEDDALLVINKPNGMVVHPGAGNQNSTLLNALLHHAPQLQELPRAGILHRLDKNTTGLLVIAKTAAALKDLTQQLKKRTMVREYQAVVYGGMISGGKVDAPIDRHPIQRKQMAVVDTGKPALTHYRVMEKYRHATRLKLRLDTGRTHQIRVHMAYIRHPVIGDPVYGGRVQLTKNLSPELIALLRNFKRQALHAFALGFNHPETGEPMRFEAEIPEDMQALTAALRDDMKRNAS